MEGLRNNGVKDAVDDAETERVLGVVMKAMQTFVQPVCWVGWQEIDLA